MQPPEALTGQERERRRAVEALGALRAATAAMLEEVDPVSSPHDDVAALILTVTLLGEAHRELREDVEAAVLDWLLRNEGGVREVRVGDWKWWGEKDKSVRCLDVGEAGAAAARALLSESLLSRVVYGDTDALDRILSDIRELFRAVVSASGLKEGATRKALQDAAERELREAAASDPGAVPALPGESAAAALERAVEAARAEAFYRHFEETWPDKLSGGEPRTKLGVANLRFVHRRGGGTKRELEELERARVAREAAGGS